MDVRQPNRVQDVTMRPKVTPGRDTPRRHRLVPASPLKIGIVAAIVIAGLLITLLAVYLFGGPNPDSSRYQAVFLTNGQVFFGKLKSTHGQYLTLDNAYYSKNQAPPAGATADQRAATSTTLVQVGKEVYGPENSMQIRSDQVLFWQDLKSDSKVAQAIDNAK